MSDEPRNARLEGKWDQAVGRVREAWGALTDDDLDRSKGDWKELVGKVRERTGETIEDIERRLSEILDRVEESGDPSDSKDG